MRAKETNLQERHFNDIIAVLNVPLPYSDITFCLRDLFNAKLLTKEIDIEEILSAAKQQAKVEFEINDIEIVWTKLALDFESWKGRAQILKSDKINEIQEKYIDDQNTIALILSKKFVTPFIKKIEKLQEMLNNIDKVLTKWIQTQIK